MGTENWRKDPDVQAARRLAQERGKSAVVVLAFHQCEYSITSYGRNKRLCDIANAIADVMAREVEVRAAIGVGPWEEMSEASVQWAKTRNKGANNGQ